MDQVCHRCGTVVSARVTFCPACGAPQLNFDASSQDGLDTGPQAMERPGHVNWRDAIGAVAMVAIPAGILCGIPVLSAFSLIWVMGGATLVVRLYRKKRPRALLIGRSGFRIGGLTGLAIAYVSLAATAILRVVERFAMHAGAAIDRDYEDLVRESMSAFQTSPETQAQVRAFFHFMLTPDGRATWWFIYMATAAVMTVFFASIGGYIGVRLFAGRRLA